jgi:hypothetical protein
MERFMLPFNIQKTDFYRFDFGAQPTVGSQEREQYRP